MRLQSGNETMSNTETYIPSIIRSAYTVLGEVVQNNAVTSKMLF